MIFYCLNDYYVGGKKLIINILFVVSNDLYNI